MSIAVLVGSMLISTLAFASEKASVSTDSKKKEVTAVQETETDESNDGFIIGGADGPTSITLAGGWEMNTGDTSIDAEENSAAKKAYEKAMNDFAENSYEVIGNSYEVIAYLGSQVVAGTNYCYLCRESSDKPNPVVDFVLVFVYEDLGGNAEISDITPVFSATDGPDDSQIDQDYGTEVWPEEVSEETEGDQDSQGDDASGTFYIGDNSKDIQLASSLPYPDGVFYESIEIQSDKEPYELRVYVKTDGKPSYDLKACADQAFKRISNMGIISFYDAEDDHLIESFGTASSKE